MAQSEATATLPRPESSELETRHESAPPAVDAVPGTTPEGLGSIKNHSMDPSLSSLVANPDQESNLSGTSPFPTKSSASTSPTVSAMELASLSNGTSAAEPNLTSSSKTHDSTTTSGHADSASIRAQPHSTSSAQPSLIPAMHSSGDSLIPPTGPSSGAPPRRFTAVNVNRKFLEKSATSAVPSAPSPSGSKTANASHSSQLQPQPSRLITAKLTSIAQAASPSAVWKSAGSSAPSSSASTPAGQPPSSTSSFFAQSAAPGHSKLVSSHASASLKLGSSGKPSSSQPAKAWGAKNGTNSVSTGNGAIVEFPTAAEAANSKKVKAEAAAAAAEQSLLEAAALKLQQTATADLFRGMHLDPKAHHWDEDGDDDDFLNEVIEFADGTQYTVKHEDTLLTGASESAEGSAQAHGDRNNNPDSQLLSTAPVRKEDRFGADIGRNWPPKPRPQPAGPSDSMSAGAGHDPHSRRPPDERNGKALFNERSNRFEQASSFRTANAPDTSGGTSSRPFPQGHPSSSGAWGRRDSHSESQGGRWQDRGGTGPNVQMLRKPSFSTQERDPSLSPTLRSGNTMSASRSNGPLSPIEPFSTHIPDSGRQSRSRGPSFTEHSRDPRVPRSDPNNGPPSVRDPSRESVRDAFHLPPPTRGEMPSPLTVPSYPQRRPSHGSREMPPPPVPNHRTASISSLTSPSIVHPPLPSNRSPTLSMASPRSSHGLLTPVIGLSAHLPQEQQPFALKAPTITDIQGFSKESMQSAAERARARRKLEEEHREKEKERARHKAAELAAAADAKTAAKRAEEEAAARLKAEAEAAAEALIREEAEALAREKAKAVKSAVPSVSTQPSTLGQPPEPPIHRARSSRGSKRGAEAKAGPPPSLWVGPTSSADVSGTLAPGNPAPTTASPAGPRASSWANVVKESDKTDVPLVTTRKDLSTIGGNSWRSKPQAPAPHLAPPLGVTVLPPLFDVTTEDHEALELFDFTDMHKLVGDTKEAGLPEVPVRSLDEVVDLTRESPDLSSRSQVSEASPRFHATRQSMDRGRPSSSHLAHSSSSQERGASLGATSTRGPGLSSPATSTKGLMSPQALASLPLPPPKPHFRESSMSALEHAMSRIKGALSNMRPGESSAAIEEALAASILARKTAHDESFAVTQRPRPSSPLPVHRRLHVRIRKEWPPKAQNHIDARLLYLWKMPPKPVRWEILSWDPPVEGMSRKTLSRDETLFPPSSNVVVSLPKSSASRAVSASSLAFLPNSAPKVNLPAPKIGRRAVRHPGNDVQASMLEVIESVSRSPPPASPARRASLSLPHSNAVSQSSVGTASPTSASPSSPSSAGKTKVPSRPTVDGVAFSRRLHGASDSVSSLVNFTVNSELEVEEPDPVVVEAASTRRLLKINTNNANEPQVPEDVRPTPSRSITPPPKSTPWAKSPLVYQPVDSQSSRNVASDPKNIKSLWETNVKDVVTTENSLEGIADEPPPSFSFPDMKSDDGDEPKSPKPPSPSPVPAPTRRIRMSVHDAHRAFQQVPPSPAGAPDQAVSSYGPIEPPISEEPRSGPSQSHSHPPHQSRATQRPSYPVYPSPSTPVMYAQSPYLMSPIGQPPQRPPLPNGHHPGAPHTHAQLPPTHMWMQVGPPAPGTSMSPYYRPTPYAQPAVIYPSPSSLVATSPFSPASGPGVMPPVPVALPSKSMNGGIGGRTPPTRSVSGSGHNTATATPLLLSPAPGPPAQMPPYVPGPGRMTPGAYYTPGVQQAQLPMVYPSSPAPMYTATVSSHSSGSASHGSALYTSPPQYRQPPPSW